MIQKISFLILWMVSVNLQAFEILNVKEGAVVTIRVPEEDVDYYEHGEIYYVVNNLNLAIVQKVEILSAKKQIVRFKCVNQCNRQLKKGAVFSLEDGPSQKSRDSKTFSVEKNKSLKFGYGYPIRSAFSGFEFARESYELDNISGFILNLQMLWRSIEPDSEVRFLGLGFFVSNISGKAKTNEGNLEVDYEVTGISIPIGVHFSKIGDWQF